MTDRWRGGPLEERPIDHWFRERYAIGSVYVLNVDKLICDPGARVGALLELKHVDATDKHWRVTRELARRLGWWSGLIEHDWSVPCFDTLLPPDAPMIPRRSFDAERFDIWVCENFGARPRREIA